MQTFQNQNDKNYNLAIIIIIAIILFIIRWNTKDWEYKTVISTMMLLLSIAALALTKNPIMWIPIVLTGSMALQDLLIRKR